MPGIRVPRGTEKGKVGICGLIFYLIIDKYKII